MQIVARRMYRDGRDELVVKPTPLRYTLPAYPVIQRILEARMQGKKPDVRDTYKLGVLCLKSLRNWHPLFQDCDTCPLASDCAVPRDPAWFRRKGIMK